MPRRAATPSLVSFRRAFVVGVLVFCGALLLGGVNAAALGADEPDHARMTIGEESYRVPLGEPFAVMLAGERVTIRIDPENSRLFSESGVAFRYPKGFAMEVNAAAPDVTVWTLQGRSATIVVQRYAAGLEPDSLRDALVDNLVERHGGDRARRQSVNLRGAEASFPGVQVVSTGAGGTEELQNVFAFASGDAVFALMVQDARPKGASDTAEYAEAIRLLGDSLKAAAAKPAE